MFDAVYNPGETELLRLAKEAGAVAVGGMEMLVYQAVAAHEIWYGTKFRGEDLEALCREAQAETERDFLDEGREESWLETSFCAGLWAAARPAWAAGSPELLDREFCDLDRFVEEREGMTVSQIFAQFGEEGFRGAGGPGRGGDGAREKSLVVASGGGTVLFPRNVEGFHRGGGEHPLSGRAPGLPCRSG